MLLQIFPQQYTHGESIREPCVIPRLKEEDKEPGVLNRGGIPLLLHTIDLYACDVILNVTLSVDL